MLELLDQLQVQLEACTPTARCGKKQVLCRSGSSQLKPARYLALKDTGGIVLLRDASKLAQVFASVATKRVLPLVGVVEVDVLIVPANALGIISNLCDCRAADVLEELVVLRVLP